MVNINEMTKENIPGKFYVKNSCVGCGMCTDSASDYFKLNEEGYACVYKQPSNDDENKICKEALENCPVNAIKDEE